MLCLTLATALLAQLTEAAPSWGPGQAKVEDLQATAAADGVLVEMVLGDGVVPLLHPE